MTAPLPHRILTHLRVNHCGHHYAIARADLAHLFGISERRLRAILTELCEEGHPIARTNRGIFLCVTEEERRENYLRYRGMAASNFRQAAAFDRAAARREAEQIGLFEGVGR